MLVEAPLPSNGMDELLARLLPAAPSRELAVGTGSEAASDLRSPRDDRAPAHALSVGCKAAVASAAFSVEAAGGGAAGEAANGASGDVGLVAGSVEAAAR